MSRKRRITLLLAAFAMTASGAFGQSSQGSLPSHPIPYRLLKDGRPKSEREKPESTKSENAKPETNAAPVAAKTALATSVPTPAPVQPPPSSTGPVNPPQTAPPPKVAVAAPTVAPPPLPIPQPGARLTPGQAAPALNWKLLSTGKSLAP